MGFRTRTKRIYASVKLDTLEDIRKRAHRQERSMADWVFEAVCQKLERDHPNKKSVG